MSSLIRQQLQYLTTKTRQDLERVIEPDKLKYEVDKAVATLVTKQLADATSEVYTQILYGQFPSGDKFLMALVKVESAFEVFKLMSDDIIASRQMTLPKVVVAESSGEVENETETPVEL